MTATSDARAEAFDHVWYLAEGRLITDTRSCRAQLAAA